MKPIKVLAATGMLGTGFSEKSFNRALEQQPDVIGCDAGSSDPGPYYLATDTPMSSREAVKRDLKIMIQGGISSDIPVIVGSAGTSGSNQSVDWTTEIVEEISAEEGLSFKLAKIYSEITNERLIQYYNNGKIKPLENAPEINESTFGNLSKTVAQMGPEPMIRALEHGADVIIAGRSSDTSIFSAVPLKEGVDNGVVWHASKILECGAGCVEKRLHPDSMFAWIYDDHFVIEPPNPQMKCTPVSVLSHFLYENTDPYQLYEPSGMIDTTDSHYEQLGERSVKISNSHMVHSDQYTVRLEGVKVDGFRRICIGGIRDPFVLKQLDEFLIDVKQVIQKKAKESLDIDQKHYDINFRTYGQSGVMGKLEPEGESMHEVGLLMEVKAETPELSQSVMSIAWHTVLHHPIDEWSGLVSQLAFPYSPPDFDGGVAYSFALNHVLELDDPFELFPIEYQDLQGGVI
ncbi:acyclic terpene utilization AtuA family protein [Alkalibacillus aidingensis]|uniref:acyclic terpene utilization AtuA family protein n=1 Tax=Alkalibacillus aidingensis TaxID=2747607 RepID=UPI001660BB73|nr:acyclic terpene utilization AtuA family protein [Alkalibacillus aidingensis]